MLPFFLEPLQSPPSPCCLVFSTWAILLTCMASPVTVKCRSRCDFQNSSRPPFSRGGPADVQQGPERRPLTSFQSLPTLTAIQRESVLLHIFLPGPGSTSNHPQAPQQLTYPLLPLQSHPLRAFLLFLGKFCF